MKKVLSTALLLITYYLLLPSPAFAACNPPQDYSSCPERHPDLNLQVRGYKEIPGSPNLIPFSHHIDPTLPPQLSTLLEGNPTPNISSLYQVYDWNWETNTKGDLIQRPIDLPSQFDLATLVGFSTQNDQAILVPNSGYDIGQGYETIVLYATANSITLEYTLEDSVATGYTLHLENFRVDPGLLALYNRLNQEGRDELPALIAGEKIGEAIGNEILVSIRDRGSFMDPRWLNDWWQTLDPATAKALLLKWLAVLKPQKFGLCLADQDLKRPVLSRGKDFRIPVYCSEDPEKKIRALLSTEKLDFSNNREIADQIKTTHDRLTPSNYKSQIVKKTTLGPISFRVCEEGTRNWFTVEKNDPKQPYPVEYMTETWLSEWWSASQELAMSLVPNSPVSLRAGQKINLAQKETSVLGENTELLAQTNAPMVSIRSVGCNASGGQINCSIVVDATPATGHVWVHANDQFLGINTTGYGLTYYYQTTIPPGAGSFTVNVNVVNHDRQPKPEDNASCVISLNSKRNGSCTTGGGAPPPTPTPELCHGYDPSGEPLSPEEIPCIEGACHFDGGNAPRAIWETIREGIKRLVCPTKYFIVTPEVQWPFLADIDQDNREGFLKIFKVNSPVAEKAFKFENDLQGAVHKFEASPGEEAKSPTEVFGQAGVKNAYDWVQQALSPASSRPIRQPGALDYSLPFRDSTISISALARATVINQVKQRWPQTKIEASWNEVFNQSVSHGWNPTFVIALWIEESGASGVDAYDLGCLGAPENNLSAQLDCLFQRPYANESFEEFMCRYSEGKHTPCVFALNPGFPKNLKYWYDFLTNQR